jgi:hypothetical protein
LISGASTRSVSVVDGGMVTANNQPVSLGDLPEPVIYKVHGSLDLPKSCAISTEQYFCSLWRMIGQQCIPKEIGSIISGTPIVLIGSRILDADFRLTYTLLRGPLIANDERRWAVMSQKAGDDRDGSYRFAKAAWKELCEVALERYGIRMLDEEEDLFFERLTDAFLAQKRL